MRIRPVDACKALGIDNFYFHGNPTNETEFNQMFKKVVGKDENKNAIISENPSDFGVTWEQVNAKIAELQNDEPMRLLREERNRRIELTDWRFRSDLSPSQEWRDYCVALRNLPQTYSPTIDILTEDDYPLVKEDNTTPWPEEPTDG